MANRTVTVKSADGDYSSLNAAFAGEVVDCADLVTGEMILTFECHNFADTTAAATGDGWTSSADYYLNIVAADDHGGKYGNSAYRIEAATNAALLRIDISHTRVKGIQYKATGTSSAYRQNGIMHGASANLSGVIVDSCVGVYAGALNTEYDGYHASGASNTGCIARNCVFYGGWNNNVYLNGTAGEIRIQSCTVADAVTTGFTTGWQRAIATNNISVGGTADFSSGWHADSSNNMSSDATAPGSNSITNTVVKSYTDDTDINAATKSTSNWVIFDDPANDDYSLVSVDDGGELNDAIEAGTTIAAFDYDIIDTTRPQGTAWDIGAFEFLAEEGATATGSATISLSSSGATTRTLGASGAASISATATGASTRTLGASGAASVSTSSAGSGTITTGVTASGAASIALSTTGAALRTLTSTGAASASLTATGTATRTVTATGSASIALSSAGTGVTEAKVASGAASISLSSTGSATRTVTATGSASVSLSTIGAAIRHLVATGAASITLTPDGSGTVTGPLTAAGVATISLSSTASATRFLTATGAASIVLSSTGADRETDVKLYLDVPTLASFTQETPVLSAFSINAPAS